MHESSLTSGLLEQIGKVARANSGRVKSVHLAIGAFLSISPEHLREHFAAAACGTPAEGVELSIRVSEDPCAPYANSVLLETVEIEES